jgi:hypothetical protein
MKFFIRTSRIAVSYIGGVPSAPPPPEVFKKNLKIILNVCYILIVLYAYLEIILLKKKKKK